MNSLIIQTHGSQGVYYINGIFHCFKIQKWQSMTPVRNNREGISPRAKAVNDTLVLEHCTFLCLKVLPQWKIYCIRRKRLFLVHNCQYLPNKRNLTFWGYLLTIILSLQCHWRLWANPPEVRKKLFGGIPKKKGDGCHCYETSLLSKKMPSTAVIMFFSKVSYIWKSWKYGHNDCNKSINTIWNYS